MKYLLLSSLIFITIACSSFNYNSLEKKADIVVSDTTLSLLGNDNYTLLFKTQVNVYGKYFSGILFFKKLSDNISRAVLLTEFGVKLLDIEFTNDSSIFHYKMEQLDNKYVLNTLNNDFKIILNQFRYEKKAELFEESKTKKIITKIKTDLGFLFYYVNNITQKIEQIDNVNKNKPVLTIKITKYKDNIPEIIFIQHETILLNISLLLLESHDTIE